MAPVIRESEEDIIVALGAFILLNKKGRINGMIDGTSTHFIKGAGSMVPITH